MKHFTINSLDPFGVEIRLKNDLNTLNNVDYSAFKSLIDTHKLILIRNAASVTKEALSDYANSLGPLLGWDFGNVMEMRVHESPKNYLFTHDKVPFHWDGAFH